MKKTTRLLSLFLALALLLTPFAQALTLEDARGLLQEHYIAELPKAAKDAQTIQDLITALGDPYTEYFTAQQYQGFLGSMQDSTIVGIGVRFHMTPEGGLVEQVYAGSAAHGAGVVAGDLITEINRTSIVGKTVEEVQPLMAGDVGSALSLTVRKPDGTPQALTLTRTNFTVPTTDSDLIDGHIGSLVCHSFGKETYQHFQDAIVANDAAADRWIVDLRDNGGGEMQAAVDAASAFAGGGQLMFLRDGKGEYAAYEAAGHALTIDPAIVLIGSYTASAAELFAATVRDRQAGVLIGSRTYGKGVAQVLLDKTSHPALFPDGDALKITAYRAFSEGNVTHDQMGVLPHIVVPPALAQDVAYLLSASRPSGDSTG
ncbi:MAG: S41 family peptidase, partial [Oscillospiraceae bacterium]